MSDVKKFAGVLKSAGSVMGAIKDGAKVAIAGRGFMKDVKWSLHVMLEDRCEAAADEAAAGIREICGREAGNEIENSIAKILRANPFTPLNNMVGPNGERWVPVHTIVPHSKGVATLAAATAVFDEHKSLMEEHGIGYGFLLASIDHNGFVIEPVFLTPDALNEIHKQTVEPSVLKKMPCFEANPRAAEVTAMLRQEIIRVFQEAGGIHMQIGKAYPFRQGLKTDTFNLIEAIKKSVDPDRRVNPGALGLEKE
jgi:hypothetical protein